MSEFDDFSEMGLIQWVWYKAIGKETPSAYTRRHQRMEAQANAREEAIQKARDDVVRASHGYSQGQGYVAGDGRVYAKKETPEEYDARTLKNLEKERKRAEANFKRK